LAYTAGSPGRMRLYVRQLEGGTPVPVVRGVGGFQRLPHWAPDGARLLFLSDRGIEIAPALGGAPRLLLPLAGAAPGQISPDGRSCLYASVDSLYLRPLDGALARLIVTGLELHSFAWSPDGRWIAYVSGNKTFIADGTFGNLAPSSVWIVRATGGAPHRATDDRNLNMSPVWMPEGRALLSVSHRDGGRDGYAVLVAAAGAPPFGRPAAGWRSSPAGTACSRWCASRSRAGSRRSSPPTRRTCFSPPTRPTGGRSHSMASARDDGRCSSLGPRAVQRRR